MADAASVQDATLYLGQTKGYWIQTVAYFLAGVGAIVTALIAIFQLRALRQQIKMSEAHSAQQIVLLREQIEASQKQGAEQIELLRKQLLSEERMAKQRATVDVVRHELTDRELAVAFKRYALLREANTLTQHACTHPGPADEHDHIMRVLNNYEYVATGIHTGAFDEEIYKRMKCSGLIRDWDALKPYVCELRSKYKKSKVFIEFENLAEKWRAQP